MQVRYRVQARCTYRVPPAPRARGLVGVHRQGGLRFTDPRALALLAVLCVFRLLPRAGALPRVLRAIEGQRPGSCCWSASRPGSGYLNLGTATYSTTGYALASDTIDLHAAASIGLM
jgi:hypothetical protein